MKKTLHLLAAIAADLRPQHRELINELVAEELGARPKIELVPNPDNPRAEEKGDFIPEEGQVEQAKHFGSVPPPAAKAKK